MPEWKDTVNLPRTGFPMKANLQTAEPEALARWQAMDLYGQIRAKRRGAPKFVFHDGPPYANGRIHLGTALNKILKDLVIKVEIDGRVRRSIHPRLRLSRSAYRAEGRPRARCEEA
jgi:isoleucyl-tRNA synthetase